MATTSLQARFSLLDEVKVYDHKHRTVRKDREKPKKKKNETETQTAVVSCKISNARSNG